MVVGLEITTLLGAGAVSPGASSSEFPLPCSELFPGDLAVLKHFIIHNYFIKCKDQYYLRSPSVQSRSWFRERLPSSLQMIHFRVELNPFLNEILNIDIK